MSNGPGKAHRKGLTLLQIADMFRDEADAIKWLEDLRWADGPYCPTCGSFNVQSNIKHKTMTHRCRECPNRRMFTLRMGSIMEGTKLNYRFWAIGIYLFTTNIKGISSMRLHRELGISQKAAWFMLQRLRKAAASAEDMFAGPVEVDETWVGGKRRNMSNSKRKEYAGRGTAGKTAVVGMKDRDTGRVATEVVQSTDKETLQGFVAVNTEVDAEVYTDGHQSYKQMPRHHEWVDHSVSEFVRGQVHTNGIESYWAMLKRGYIGVYHKMSPKHLDLYASEFEHRHNVRNSDTIAQMSELVDGMSGKRLKYHDLVADNGLPSGAR